MLGLDPLPERSDLQPVVTGRVEPPEFTVEKLQFQSRPGLYVTGNLAIREDTPIPISSSEEALIITRLQETLYRSTAAGRKVAYE